MSTASFKAAKVIQTTSVNDTMKAKINRRDESIESTMAFNSRPFQVPLTGYDVNGDGRADIYFPSDTIYTEQKIIPQTIASVPATSIRTTPLGTTVVPNTYQTVPYQGQILQSSANSIVPYNRNTRMVEYVEQPYDVYKDTSLAIQPYYPQETFSHAFWQEVLRPIGIGIASPIAGAGAFIGGVACGTGALVAGCAFGLVSTLRGVFGILPIGVDYVLRPASYGIDYAASGMDDMVDKAVGGERAIQLAQGKGEEYLEKGSGYAHGASVSVQQGHSDFWSYLGYGDDNYYKPTTYAIEDWNNRRPPTSYIADDPKFQTVQRRTRPYGQYSTDSIPVVGIDVNGDGRVDYLAEVTPPQTNTSLRYGQYTTIMS